MFGNARSQPSRGRNHTVSLKSRPSSGRDLAFAFATLCLMAQMWSPQVHCAPLLVNHLVEVPATSLPTLPDGTLRYLSGLKPTGSSMGGVFIHMTKTPLASDGNIQCQLFDATPELSFPRKTPLDVPGLANMVLVRVNYEIETGYLHLENQISTSTGGVQTSLITFDSMSNSFKSGPRVIIRNVVAGVRRVILMTEDGTTRYVYLAFPNVIDPKLYRVSGPSTVLIHNADLVGDSSGSYVVDKVIQIDKYRVLFNALGQIHIDDDSIQDQVVGSLVTINLDSFKPLYVTKDQSTTCTLTGCQVIVYEIRTGGFHYLTMTKFVMSPTIVVNYKFESLSITAVGVAGMSFQVPNQKFVVLAGTTQFYMFKILEDKFEAFTDFKGPTYTGSVAGSVVVGAYDTSKYPNSVPVMMMFQEGPNFKAKMFAFQQVTCSSQDAEGYCSSAADGLGINKEKLVTKCKADCLKCTTDLNLCDLCSEGYLTYQRICYKCEGFSGGAIYVQESGTSCVNPAAPLYSEGFGTIPQNGVNMLEKCTALNCLTCNSQKSKCSACISTYRLYDGVCTLCADAATQALLIGVGDTKCVLKADPLYADGYGVKTGTPFPIIHKCSVENCKVCDGSADSCTTCSIGFQSLKGGSKTTCTVPAGPGVTNTGTGSTNNSTNPQNPGRSVRVFRHFDRNSMELIFPDTESRHIEKIFVNDLKNRKTYSCEETGCSNNWQDKLLTVVFKSSIQVTAGELRITRKPVSGTKGVTTSESNINRHRTLQLNEEDIVIPNLILLGNSWFPVCITIIKILVLLSRTVLSVLLFWKYPILSMAADYLVTGCLLLFIVLGPVLQSAELFFQTISSVKLPWYQLPNIFRNWDSQTLFADTLPNHREHGVLNSFLDNYGVNAVSFCGLAVCVFDCYGWKYFLAKLQANSLEILIYTVISLAKADASSKSIIGIVLAVTTLLCLVWIKLGTTIWINQTHLKMLEQQQPDHGVLRIHTEEVNLQASPSIDTPIPAHRPANNWSTKVVHSSLGQYMFSGLFFKYSVMNMKEYNAVWKGLLPLITFTRDLAFAVLALNQTQSSLLQLVILSCIQTGYLAYFLSANHSSQLYELTATIALQFFIGCSLILKAVSTSTHLSDSALQNGIGPVIGILGVIILFVLLGFQVLALFRCYSSDSKASIISTQIEVIPSKQVDDNKLQTENNWQLDMSVWPQGQQAQEFAALDLQIPEENLKTPTKGETLEHNGSIPQDCSGIRKEPPLQTDQ